MKTKIVLTAEASQVLCEHIRTIGIDTLTVVPRIKTIGSFLKFLDSDTSTDVQRVYKSQLRKARRVDKRTWPTLRELMSEAPPLSASQVRQLERFSKTAPKAHAVHMLLIDHRQYCEDYYFDKGLSEKVLDEPAQVHQVRVYRQWKRRRGYALRLLSKL